MNSVSLLLMFIGVFVLFNATNIVGVIKGDKVINFTGAKPKKSDK